MKKTLEKITEAFRQLDDHNLKEDDSLIIIAHTNDGDLVTAIAGKSVDWAASLAIAMDKNSDFEEAVWLGLWALEQDRKQNGQPKDEENEAEDKK